MSGPWPIEGSGGAEVACSPVDANVDGSIPAGTPPLYFAVEVDLEHSAGHPGRDIKVWAVCPVLFSKATLKITKQTTNKQNTHILILKRGSGVGSRA